MQRLTALDGTGGPSACAFPNLAELNARDDARGPLVRGLRPKSPIVYCIGYCTEAKSMGN
jgi:hypothetical protein